MLEMRFAPFAGTVFKNPTSRFNCDAFQRNGHTHALKTLSYPKL